jgi:predicted transcriptional regulator
MPDIHTLTIRLTPETTLQLEKMSRTSGRSKNYLAAEAITHYVGIESESLDAIIVGAADVQAGRIVSADAAMKRIRATLSAPRKR